MDWKDKFLLGNVMDVLRQLPAESIDCCVTSPPYYSLRTYGGAEVDWGGGWYPWHGELGLEPTPELYLTHLWSVFDEVWRVMKKTGTMWVNIGDTYGGSQGRSGGKGHEHNGQEVPPRRESQPKCLLAVPERFILGMIDRGWILRNKIVWHKPNPMPSSAKDRFTNTYEPVYFFTKAKRYWFDLDAVRERHTEQPVAAWGPGGKRYTKPEDCKGHQWIMNNREYNPSGKNPGDVWRITTQPFPEAHFATFPEELARRCIKAGCPKEVCPKCGKGRVRITRREPIPEEAYLPRPKMQPGNVSNTSALKIPGSRRDLIPDRQTLGWTSCSCSQGYVAGVTLDPFGGSGTVATVAWEQGRSFVYIDIKQEYIDMAKKRLADKMREIPRAGDDRQAETIGQEVLKL